MTDDDSKIPNSVPKNLVFFAAGVHALDTPVARRVGHSESPGRIYGLTKASYEACGSLILRHLQMLPFVFVWLAPSLSTPISLALPPPYYIQRNIAPTQNASSNSRFCALHGRLEGNHEKQVINDWTGALRLKPTCCSDAYLLSDAGNHGSHEIIVLCI